MLMGAQTGLVVWRKQHKRSYDLVRKRSSRHQRQQQGRAQQQGQAQQQRQEQQRQELCRYTLQLLALYW